MQIGKIRHSAHRITKIVGSKWMNQLMFKIISSSVPDREPTFMYEYSHTKSTYKKLWRRIWGSHSGGYEEFYLLGYNAVYSPLKPITVAMRSRVWNVFARSNTGIVGSNPIQGMDVCVYSAFLLGSGLASGLIPRPRSPTDCLRLRKVKWNEAFHGCPVLQVGATGVDLCAILRLEWLLQMWISESKKKGVPAVLYLTGDIDGANLPRGES
jgi:hypothetical protein